MNSRNNLIKYILMVIILIQVFTPSIISVSSDHFDQLNIQQTILLAYEINSKKINSLLHLIPPIYEQQKLFASDGQAFDRFGLSVAITDYVLVIGSPYNDENGYASGAAYVYRYNGSAWIEEQKLLASDGSINDFFGYAVAIDGNRILIGSYGNDNRNGQNAGAVYLYHYDGLIWHEEAKLLASDGAEDDVFGWAVAIQDAVLIGAPYDDDNGDNSGSAYIFRHIDDKWVEETKLLASDGKSGDEFGCAVDIDNDRCIIGAAQHYGGRKGAAYIFYYAGLVWVEEQKLLNLHGEKGNNFGRAVAISDNRVIIGEPRNNMNGNDSGVAFLYFFNGANWVKEQMLLASDGNSGDEFGGSVAIDNEIVVIGSTQYQGCGKGAAYVYVFNGCNWLTRGKLLASDGMDYDLFGCCLDIYNHNAIVGAWGEGQNPVDTGASYFYSLILGDVNGDGVVNVEDLLILLAEWGKTDSPADINGDDIVNTADLLILLANWTG